MYERFKYAFEKEEITNKARNTYKIILHLLAIGIFGCSHDPVLSVLKKIWKDLVQCGQQARVCVTYTVISFQSKLCK